MPVFVIKIDENELQRIKEDFYSDIIVRAIPDEDIIADILVGPNGMIEVIKVSD